MIYNWGINDSPEPVSRRESTGKKITSKNGVVRNEQILVWECPYYKVWVDMLRRAHNKKYQEKYPTYMGTTICEDWKYFSKFKAWMTEQDWVGNQLDKDLLVEGNKHYSPETCIFVSALVNTFMISCESARGKYAVGVCWNKVANKFQADCRQLGLKKRKRLGCFETEEAASEAYQKEKAVQAKILADMQKDVRISEALMKRYPQK